jgi:hypothetical protein
MATVVSNPKGYRVIECTNKELGAVTGLYDCICDNCNEPKQHGYLITVLNAWFCEECYKDFTQNNSPYPEDEPYELMHFRYWTDVLHVK